MLLVSNGFKIGIFGRNSFADLFNGGKIRVFSGNRPSLSESQEPAGTWLGDVTWAGYDTGLQFYQFGPYISKNTFDAWELRPVNNGTASWWRLVTSSDDGSGSLTAPRIDGDVGTIAAPAELLLTSTVLTADTSLPIDGFIFTIPPFIGV